MKKWKNYVMNMKVKKKITYLSLLLIIMDVLVGLLGVTGAFFMNQRTEEITEEWIPTIQMVQTMNTRTSDYRLNQYGHVVATTDEWIQNCEEQMNSLEEELSALSAEYKEIISSAEEETLYNDMNDTWTHYLETSQTFLELSRNRETEQASELLQGDLKDFYDDFQKQINLLIDYDTQATNRASNLANSTFYFVLAMILIFIVLSIVLAKMISKQIADVIVTPLKEAENAMKSMAGGDLNVTLNYESKDEIGNLLEQTKVFIQNLTTIINDEKNLLHEMANGNFDIRSSATEYYVGDFETLLTSIRKIHQALGSTLSDFAVSAEQVNAASDQVASAAQQLADGAREQASAVEELTATVDDTAEQAKTASEQAVSANSKAEMVIKEVSSGNQQMDELITAMDRISSTSNEIAGIINTIDSIASQTNLLSLNASIEAARAGEAGRGFAVVADEIGQLALQCSQAASDTKQLIETAVVQAQSGDGIAKKTAEALEIITGGVQDVTDDFNKVRLICENQAKAMNQIDEGIQVISKVVEENYAAAEESSATSEELSAHAENLNERLSKFQFRND